jgi:hypothetical protein
MLLAILIEFFSIEHIVDTAVLGSNILVFWVGYAAIPEEHRHHIRRCVRRVTVVVRIRKRSTEMTVEEEEYEFNDTGW